MGALDTRMFVVKDFIDEFYNKTLFQSGKVVNPELTPSEICYHEYDRLPGERGNC